MAAYHRFEPGEAYDLEEVVAELTKINSSGRIKNVEQKAGYIDMIRRSGESQAVFEPFSTGWGASPLNPRVWKRLDGEDLCPDG